MVPVATACHYRCMQPQDPTSSTYPGHPDSSHLDGLPLAALAVDPAGTVRYVNAAASGLFGRQTADMTGTAFLSVAFGEEDRGSAEEVVNHVLSGRSWSGTLSLVNVAAEAVPVHLTATPLRQDGEVVGALVIAQETSGAAVDRRSVWLGERLTRLARVAAELVMADSMESVTKSVISHAADAAGATIASLSTLVDAETLALQGLRGGLEGASARWARWSIHDNTPAGEAVRTGRQILLVGKDHIQQRYPDLESAASGERTLICLPLKVTTRTFGVISLSFPGLRQLDSAELEFLGILADICAQALDRIQALDEAADQTGKLEFLAHASSALSSSLDYQATLTNVAKLGVPTFADWCAIALAEDGDLHTLAVAHLDPEKVALAEELQRKYPSDRDAPQGSFHVLRTGVSELIPDITDEMLIAGTQDEEHLRLARELNLRSALVVPLVARGKVLGVVTWVSGESGRRFEPDDLAFAEDLARRAAVAIDNSQLHSETRETAVRLQEAVLPETLTPLPGWDIAAHYSPAGRTEVGGDFYDVIPLDDGMIAMFVGDVMGRGVAAAAAMAQMRAAVRAYLALDPDPSAVMNRLDVMFDKYDITQLVTLVYAVAYPDRDELRVANAGHPPPVLIRANGSAQQLPSGGDAPLGIGNTNRSLTVVPFRMGDTLVAFTDGLIERRTEDIDEGQRRVVDHFSSLRSGDLPTTLDLPTMLTDLVDAVRDHTRDDDVAALAARRTG